MSLRLRRLGLAAVAFGLTLVASASPALAQKSGGSTSTGGGGTSTGGGGGGGGTKVTTTTVIVPLLGGYYGIGGSGSTVARGSATLVYDATQTVRSISVDLGNVNLPDGSIVHAEMYSNGYVIPTSYYPVWGDQAIGDMGLLAGASTLKLSTANGDLVPLFGTAGNIYVNLYDGAGNLLGTIVSGSFSTVAKGNKPSLGP